MPKPIRNNLIVELHVPDLEIARNFYTKLGFDRAGVDDRINQNELGYLTLIRQDEVGKTMLNFYGGDDRVYSQSYFKQFPKDMKRGYAVELTIPVAKIDKMYRQVEEGLLDSVVREMQELRDHDHVWRDFRLVDPFGFYLRFTELLDWGQGVGLEE